MGATKKLFEEMNEVVSDYKLINDSILLRDSAAYTKERVNTIVENTLQQLEGGNASALDIKLRLKFFENIVKEFGKTCLDKFAREEAEKYGAKFELKGAKIELAETGAKYDYSNCNDSIYNDLLIKQTEIDQQVKERETFLKAIKDKLTIVNEDSGEITEIYPPVKSSNSSIKVTL